MFALVDIAEESLGNVPTHHRLLRHIESQDDATDLHRMIWHPWTDARLQQLIERHRAALQHRWLLPLTVRMALGSAAGPLLEDIRAQWESVLEDVRARFCPPGGHQKGRQLFHAFMLADWALSLEGLEPEPDANGSERLDLLLHDTARAVDPGQHKRMDAYWKAMEESFLGGIRALDEVAGNQLVLVPAARASLKARRSRVRSLRKRFSEIFTELESDR